MTSLRPSRFFFSKINYLFVRQNSVVFQQTLYFHLIENAEKYFSKAEGKYITAILTLPQAEIAGGS